MKRKQRGALFGVSLVVAFVLMLVGIAGCGDQRAEGPGGKDAGLYVVTTTSLIGHIVDQVGGDRVRVATIVPPASCPGHFDVKPAEMKVLTGADIFFVHAWQGEMFTDELIRSVGNEHLRKEVLAIEGNWMTPPVQKAAIEHIAAVLAEADPDNASFFEANAAAQLETVDTVGQELAARLAAAGVDSVKVLVSEMQTGFLKWAGFDVVAPFGRPEDMSPREMEDLLALGREAQVDLVVDNLQSGHEAGKTIARDLGARHVMLSNFPGGLPGTDTWELAIKKNVDLLLEAIEVL